MLWSHSIDPNTIKELSRVIGNKDKPVDDFDFHARRFCSEKSWAENELGPIFFLSVFASWQNSKRHKLKDDVCGDNKRSEVFDIKNILEQRDKDA